jgi:hypothetical protein
VATSPAASGAVRVEVLHRFVVPEPSVGHLALTGTTVAFTAGTVHSGGTPDHAEMIDLVSGERRVFARTAWPSGQVDWVEASGGSIVFTDQSRIQDDRNRKAAWTISVFDTTTGKTKQVASSGGQQQEYLPLPHVNGQWVSWDERTTDGRAFRMRLADLRTGQVRDVRVHPYPQDVTVAAGRLVFDSRNGGGEDLYATSLTGHGPVVLLTHSHHVVFPRASGDVLTWQEPPPNDPTSVWEDDLTAGTGPQRVYQGRNLGNAVAGDGFAAWFDPNGGGQVAAPGRPATTFDKQISVAPRLAASGRLLAWGLVNRTGSTAETATISVARVTP